MSAARIFVRAIVVTDGFARHLDEVFTGLAAQSLAPDALQIVVTGDSEVHLPHATSGEILRVASGSTYNEAVNAAIALHEAVPGEFLWLLHDDTAALPDALAALVTTTRRRPRAAVVGAVQVQWRDSSRLVNVGMTTSRVGARRINLVDDDDINQGQYDARDDVLAVSLAGALVRREVWEAFRGLDSAYGAFGTSLHFCRMAWRAGYDVVIVPGAKIRHSQETLHGHRTATRGGPRTTYAQRRASDWYHALAWARVWWIPFLVLWSFASAAARVVLRVAQNDSRLVWADLAVPWIVLARLPRLLRTRHRIRRVATAPRSVERELLVTARGVVEYARSRYRRERERWRAAAAPNQIVRGELRIAATRRRWSLSFVSVVAAAISVALFGAWLPPLLGGQMLAGAALGVTDISFSDLWQRSTSGWDETGFGAPAVDGTFAALLSPLAAAPGGARVWWGLLLAAAPLLAALSAWFATGAATRSLAVRALSALSYALWPIFLVSVAHGLVGAVVAHLALPWCALGVARAVGWQRGERIGGGEEYPPRRYGSPSASAGAGIALAIAVAAAPVLLVPATGVLVALAVVARRRWFRVVAIAVPAVVISAPGLFAARGLDRAQAWAVIARENGPVLPTPAAQPWELVLGLEPASNTDGWWASPWIVGAVPAVVLLAAIIALLSLRATPATAVGWLAAGSGVAIAVAVQRTVVVYADGSGATDANGWPGAGLSFALVGLLAASSAASAGAWGAGAGLRRAWRRVGAVALLTVTTSAVGIHVVAQAWPGRPAEGDVSATRVDVLPLVAALDQAPPSRSRVMTLTDADGGFTFAISASDGTQVLTGRAGVDADGHPLVRPGIAVATPQSLAGAVAELTVGGGSGATDIAAWGVGVVVATPGSPRAAAALGQSTDLSLIGASELGTSYRILRDGGDISRAWIEAAPDSGVIPLAWSTDGVRAAVTTDGGTLVLAEAADSGWAATFDGVPLARVADERGRVAFTMPAGTGELSATYDDPAYRGWWWAAAATLALAVVASVPIHDRARRGVRP